MRRLALLTLALLVAFAALPPAPARADDTESSERLVNRVELLIDVVAALRAEIVALEERLARLEARLAEKRVEATAEATVVLTPPAVTGAYVMDRAASVEVMVEKARTWEGEDFDEKATRARFEAEFAGVDMRLTLKEDGTFEASLSGVGDDDQVATGTWTRKGAEITLVAASEAGGDPEAEAVHEEVHHGVWEAGRLTLSDAEGTFSVVFEQK